MATKVKTGASRLIPVQETRDSIISLLDDLPTETLTVVQQFVVFLHEQTRQGHVVAVVDARQRPPYRYPTAHVPASSMVKWTELLPEGYEGDALVDTEALYNDV